MLIAINLFMLLEIQIQVEMSLNRIPGKFTYFITCVQIGGADINLWGPHELNRQMTGIHLETIDKKMNGHDFFDDQV